MSQKTIDALNHELKFIAWKMDEIKSRMKVLVERHDDLTQDLDDLSRHYERTAVLLDDLERGNMPKPEIVETINGVPMLKGMMKQEIVSEFGSPQPVRFADPTNCFVRDENGDELMCACGKKSVILVAGKESFTAMCHACREKLYDKN